MVDGEPFSCGGWGHVSVNTEAVHTRVLQVTPVTQNAQLHIAIGGRGRVLREREGEKRKDKELA